MTNPSRLSVLIVEDCEDDYALEVLALQQSGFDVSSMRVENSGELRAALAMREWQLVISDYSLPSLDGLATLRLVRTLCHDLPLIIVSGTIHEVQAVEAMRAGARDYVFKGNLARLGPAVRRELGEFEGRKRGRSAEVNLLKAEDRFRIAAMTSSNLIFEWDLGPEIDYYGDVEGLLGYAPGEFLHTYEAWAEAVHPDDRERVLAEQRISVEHAAPYAVEYRIRGKDGTLHWWSVQGAMSRVAGTLPSRFIGTITDITVRVRREEELRQRNEELERFTYTVSHDLRSPLVTIQTFLGFLKQDLAAGDPAAVAADLSYIQRGAAKMARLIDYLLDISRVGRVVNPPVSLSMRMLASEVLDSLAGRILERGVVVVIAPEDVVLWADRVRVAEIWQNLIENALKYLGDQPLPRLWVGIERVGADTVFYVRDNGIGIEDRYMLKIFNLFEKLDPSTNGFGFGLALVKRIVELYEGRVWAESDRPGRGSCFRFTLPRALQQAKETN